jgi:hypothetical protein
MNGPAASQIHISSATSTTSRSPHPPPRSTSGWTDSASTKACHAAALLITRDLRPEQVALDLHGHVYIIAHRSWFKSSAKRASELAASEQLKSGKWADEWQRSTPGWSASARHGLNTR